MKYSVVIFPTKSLQDFVNSYRKRYDPYYTHIPPHITLKSGFEADDGHINEIVQKLHDVAKKTSPFDITVTKFSSFKPVNNVIYLKINPKEDLENLHSDIYARFPDHVPDYLYVPHITIGQALSNDEHTDVYGSLNMLQVNMQDTIDRFHLLYQLENDSWTVYETFLFGKE
ncbi:2'-5' RNA ligase family protein [Bacillus sp. V3B]|uniref:2'-5' RNA ligase family protein n=1 Tax=Bacillus sp. V3B TaxID=2804915 RepID=UPI00210AF37C|nr:2'-5' RNA ligase family protein [Bacillus sp. V3B]MCQ6274280.1 2'-5' RNA ligase family protein [Bacillus sp. V3B]